MAIDESRLLTLLQGRLKEVSGKKRLTADDLVTVVQAAAVITELAVQVASRAKFRTTTRFGSRRPSPSDFRSLAVLDGDAPRVDPHFGEL